MSKKYTETALKQLKKISTSNLKDAESFKEIEEDKEDYYSALKTKIENKKWFSHSEIKKELGLC